jgi:TfoX/Sxy family transcriptional regulator of competence genes
MSDPAMVSQAMTDGQGFKDHVRDQRAALGEKSDRPMFGGHGISWGETIVGILSRDRLDLTVDDRSQANLVSRGMGPFRPNERQPLKSSSEVPPEVLADPEVLPSRARAVIRAAIPS